MLFLGVAGGAAPAAADAPAAPTSISDQIVQIVNQDRTSAGLNALTVDPRLTAVAQQRAQFLIDHHFFSHCSGGEADITCPQSGLDITGKMAAAGIAVNFPGTTIAENLALNNYLAASPNTASAQTNQAWLNSTEHRANILDGKLMFTGVAVACCWVGSYGGTNVQPGDQASVYVQVFSGGPGATPPATATSSTAPASPVPSSGTSCQFVLGFATLASLIPQQVGQCTDDEGHNPANGDALQHTSGGLLVWRKADNWTAFTDGYHTWVNGPYGLKERLNTQRFAWEANPTGLPVVS